MERIPPLVSTLAFVLALGADLAATTHAVLQKRDARAAVAWVGLIWLVPGLGAILYFVFGINRIRRKAIAIHRDRRRFACPNPHAVAAAAAGQDNPRLAHLTLLARAGEAVSRRPLVAGNRVEPLIDGDAAYPAMLETIDSAAHTVTLCSFIFDNDHVGRQFVAALARAAARGVRVRVLIDGVGAKYSLPPIDRALRQAGVPTARFLPTLAPAALPFVNLRNHRKVMVVDGRIGFCGGMNIRAGHVIGDNPPHPTRDVHFRFTGPVVAQLQDAFAEDWAFVTGEVLEGPGFYPELAPAGPVLARAITDGPDDDFETLHALILAALASAQHSVRIVTPYFLPDRPLIAALATAALRGVAVDVLIPERGNIQLVDWAATAQLWQVLRPGCRVHTSSGPFDHSKLMVVDRAFALVGSTNWDPRSLRLNFELNVECYDEGFAAALDALIAERITAARRLTLQDVDRRPMPVKLRDGLARLLSPYL